jgi:hypothetical protein
MVLANLGLDLSEAELRTLCDCIPFGTEALKAVNAVCQLGFPQTVKHTLSTHELAAQVRRGVYPIVFVNTLPIDGIKDVHALVVIDMDQAAVAVYDPLRGGPREVSGKFGSFWMALLVLRLTG